MAKFTQQVEIDAIQYTGSNLKTVQKFCGDRAIDPAGKYKIPVFDEANTWLPDRRDADVTAVIFMNGTFYPVPDDAWIVKAVDGTFSIFEDEAFRNHYGEPVPEKKSTRKKSESGQQG